MAQIHDLILARDAKALEAFLLAEPNAAELVNEIDDRWGCTPLFFAVERESVDYEIVRVLLEAGADPNYVKVQVFPGIPVGEDQEFEDELAAAGIQTDMFGFPKEFRTRTISHVVRTGDLELVKLFERHGADLLSPDQDGYSTVLNAVCSDNDPIRVVDYLLRLGVSPDTKSSYGETAIFSAMNFRWYKTVELLLGAGAEEEPLAWTPLIRAVALGGPTEVELELTKKPDLEATDGTGHTALQVALRRGDEALVELLLAAGASIEKQDPEGRSSLHCAIESGNTSLVLRILEASCPVEEKDMMGETALTAATASGNLDVVRVLLAHGANPTKGVAYESIVSGSKNKQTMQLLLDAGADPAELDAAGRRTLVGLGSANESELASITREQYLQARYEREGDANPEELTEPFRLAMIRSGCNAYAPRRRFDDMPTFACPRTWETRPPQVWCFDRFGQSFTSMPDGRTIMIAGEHEDSYDPDFCIYNDITVFYPDGQIRVFGYPYQVFEPTDFHTATLVGDFIWIVGGLGYPEQRDGPVPVYRLDTRDYSIERVTTSGDVPRRFYRHRAILRDEVVIEIGSGSETRGIPGGGTGEEESMVLRLDTATHVWARERR